VILSATENLIFEFGDASIGVDYSDTDPLSDNFLLDELFDSEQDYSLSSMSAIIGDFLRSSFIFAGDRAKSSNERPFCIID
jgi:hypothetical protein